MLEASDVEKALDEIRPALQADGGNIELVKVEGNDVHLRLVGACAGCPGAQMTLRMGVERVLRKKFPDLGQVIPV
jgi:Fe-S cluster biogenesis protein NfuA